MRTTKNIFFKSIKCHTFLESQARPNSNDDDNDDDDYDNDDINEDNKKEEGDNNFFSKLSSIIPFWYHKLIPI